MQPFCWCVRRSGFPNDEALEGHPLWALGLKFYRLHEVRTSEWLEEMRTIERKHPAAADVPFPAARHFLLTFHDSMLEALASGVVPVSRHRTFAQATAAMIDAITA